MSQRRTRAARPQSAASRSVPATLPLGALAAGMGLSLLAAPVMAQNEPATSPTTQSTPANPTLPTVGVKAKNVAKPAAKETYQAVTTTIGKGKQELRDIPQSVTVVTEKLMDDRNLTDLKDVLRTTAGVTFLAGETGEEDVRLRGFSLAQAGDLYIDGMRDPSLYERDTFNYDRVEVLRGSASMLFGRGSTGGVVNQVNKQPFLMNQTEIETTAGTGNMYRVTADVNVKTGDTAALRINAMKHEADNHGATVSKQGIAPTYRWGIGTSDEFTASLYHLQYDNNPIYAHPGTVNRVWLSQNGKIKPLAPNNAFYGLDSDYNKGRADYVTLSHLKRLGNGAELKTSIRHGHFERDLLGTVPGFTGGTTLANFSDATVLTRTTSKGRIAATTATLLQSDYTNKMKLAGIDHSVIAGVDLSWDKGRRANTNAQTRSGTGTQLNTTIGNPDDGAVIEDNRGPAAFNFFSSRNLGAYAQDTIALTPQLKLIGGVRYDAFSAHYHNATENYDRTDRLWSNRFGALYQPTDWASFHISRGTSFNVSADAYQFELGSPTNRAKTANTPPEKSRNTEVGSKLTLLDQRLSINASLFYSEKFNERNTDPDSAATQQLLSGKRHAAGVDLDVAGQITDKWESYFSWTWIPDARIDKSNVTGNAPGQGDRPGLTPKHSGSLWNTYQLTPQWRLGLGVNHRGSQTPTGSKLIRGDDFTTDRKSVV